MLLYEHVLYTHMHICTHPYLMCGTNIKIKTRAPKIQNTTINSMMHECIQYERMRASHLHGAKKQDRQGHCYSTSKMEYYCTINRDPFKMAEATGRTNERLNERPTDIQQRTEVDDSSYKKDKNETMKL